MNKMGFRRQSKLVRKVKKDRKAEELLNVS